MEEAALNCVSFVTNSEDNDSIRNRSRFLPAGYRPEGPFGCRRGCGGRIRAEWGRARQYLTRLHTEAGRKSGAFPVRGQALRDPEEVPLPGEYRDVFLYASHVLICDADESTSSQRAIIPVAEMLSKNCPLNVLR